LPFRTAETVGSAKRIPVMLTRKPFAWRKVSLESMHTEGTTGTSARTRTQRQADVAGNVDKSAGSLSIGIVQPAAAFRGTVTCLPRNATLRSTRFAIPAKEIEASTSIKTTHVTPVPNLITALRPQGVASINLRRLSAVHANRDTSSPILPTPAQSARPRRTAQVPKAPAT